MICLRKQCFAVLALLLVAVPLWAQNGSARFLMEEPGIALEDANTLLAAVPLVYRGTAMAEKVEVQSVRLGSAKLMNAKTFPLVLRKVVSQGRVVVQSAFSTTRFRENRRYLLEIKGRYTVGGKTVGFSLNRQITVPPMAPGSAQVQTAEAQPHSVSGAQFPHQDIVIHDEVNTPGPPVPTGTLRGNLTPEGLPTSLQARPPSAMAPEDTRNYAMKVQTSGPRGPNMLDAETRSGTSVERTLLAPTPDLVFVKNTRFGGPGGEPNDPSGATGGNAFEGAATVLASGNTYGSFSTDGGSTFTQLDPTTIFPNMFDGGLCCDQVIHYSPSINRYIWLMQFWNGADSQNRLRIAVASPEALVASKGTAWTFWDLTSALFNLGNHGMDYPDLAVGNNFLYVSVDTTDVFGLLVARIPLTELRDGVTIHFQFTHPSDAKSAYGVHLIQNPGDEIFWAGHPTASSLRIFSWNEGSTSYFWRDVAINTVPADFTAISPDGTNWLSSLFSGGPGGVRILNPGADEIWFEWMGGRGGAFPQPHIQIARIRHSDFSLIQQTQIWNAGFAFGYASFTANANNLVGVSLAFGGGGFFGSPAVGIMGDGVVFPLCISSANAFRYGDYATVRQAFPNDALFAAEGYCVNPQDPRFDPHFVVFGRSGDVGR